MLNRKGPKRQHTIYASESGMFLEIAEVPGSWSTRCLLSGTLPNPKPQTKVKPYNKP